MGGIYLPFKEANMPLLETPLRVQENSHSPGQPCFIPISEVSIFFLKVFHNLYARQILMFNIYPLQKDSFYII